MKSAMTDTPKVSENRDAAQRWHTQSILGGGNVPPEDRGDCVRACITSILGKPLDAMAHFPATPIVGTRSPRGGQTRWFIFYKPLNEEAVRVAAA